MRRSDRQKRKKRSKPVRTKVPEQKVTKTYSWYDQYYRQLLIIPFLLLLLAFAQLTTQYVTTGDLFARGVSLKGGVYVTVPTLMTPQELQEGLKEKDVEVRTIEEFGTQVALTITADFTDPDMIDAFAHEVGTVTSVSAEDISVETIGSSLGETFFLQTVKALFIAFIFMGFVVFLYFGESLKIKIITGISSLLASIFMYNVNGTLNIIALILGLGIIITYARSSIPSIAVMLAAFSDIVVTLAIINLLGMKLSTASIAAFLMLIGYSVDTDILLSTRVVKRTVGKLNARIWGAVQTGLVMNATTLAAVTVALIVAESIVLSQIMTVLLIGLLVDMVNTWLQNVGILKWHLESYEVGK